MGRRGLAHCFGPCGPLMQLLLAANKPMSANIRMEVARQLIGAESALKKSPSATLNFAEARGQKSGREAARIIREKNDRRTGRMKVVRRSGAARTMTSGPGD